MDHPVESQFFQQQFVIIAAAGETVSVLDGAEIEINVGLSQQMLRIPDDIRVGFKNFQELVR
jgi:hypothetical protein